MRFLPLAALLTTLACISSDARIAMVVVDCDVPLDVVIDGF